VDALLFLGLGVRPADRAISNREASEGGSVNDVPYGFCHCGCGEKTRISHMTDRHHGYVKGEPRRYVAGHHGRPYPVQFVIDPETGCWEWLYARRRDGYGYVNAVVNGRRRPVTAHRVYYERYVGPIPEGLQLDHLCRNRGCVNPAHLEPVTQRENILRGESPAAKQARQTHCKYGHPFSAENTRRDKKGARWCRACERRRSHEKYERRKRALA
jgi:hypothetical protein